MKEEVGEMELVANRRRISFGEEPERRLRIMGGGHYLVKEIAEIVLGLSEEEFLRLCSILYQKEKDGSPILEVGGYKFLPRDKAVIVAGKALSLARNTSTSKRKLKVEDNGVEIVAKKLMQNLKEHKVKMGLFNN